MLEKAYLPILSSDYGSVLQTEKWSDMTQFIFLNPELGIEKQNITSNPVFNQNWRLKNRNLIDSPFLGSAGANWFADTPYLQSASSASFKDTSF